MHILIANINSVIKKLLLKIFSSIPTVYLMVSAVNIKTDWRHKETLYRINASVEKPFNIMCYSL